MYIWIGWIAGMAISYFLKPEETPETKWEVRAITTGCCLIGMVIGTICDLLKRGN